jgi:hypothetical protein
MPSPRSSRPNLARYRERAGLRTANESLAIKRGIWQWGLLSPEHREPATQGELAKALGVRRSYVWRILKRLPFDEPLVTSPVTPAHVIAMRERQEQYRRQQDEQARREAEDWTAAWHEEELRAQQQGYSPEQQSGDVNDVFPSASIERSGEHELRRMCRKAVIPRIRNWLRTCFPG